MGCVCIQGGDDEYEYNPDDFEDPYTPEELAEYAAKSKNAAVAAPAPAST
jgi:hypothetical protein